MAKPTILAASLFSSPGAVADNFHTLCCALAQQTRLSVLTSSPLQDRAIPGAADTCYLDFPKQRPWRWLAPALWLRLLRYVRREPFDLAFLYSEHPVHLAVSVTSRARRALFWCLLAYASDRSFLAHAPSCVRARRRSAIRPTS